MVHREVRRVPSPSPSSSSSCALREMRRRPPLALRGAGRGARAARRRVEHGTAWAPSQHSPTCSPRQARHLPASREPLSAPTAHNKHTHTRTHTMHAPYHAPHHTHLRRNFWWMMAGSGGPCSDLMLSVPSMDTAICGGRGGCVCVGTVFGRCGVCAMCVWAGCGSGKRAHVHARAAAEGSCPAVWPRGGPAKPAAGSGSTCAAAPPPRPSMRGTVASAPLVG